MVYEWAVGEQMEEAVTPLSQAQDSVLSTGVAASKLVHLASCNRSDGYSMSNPFSASQASSGGSWKQYYNDGGINYFAERSSDPSMRSSTICTCKRHVPAEVPTFSSDTDTDTDTPATC